MGGPLIISIVDDDPHVRESLTRILNSAGWTVRSYASGEAFFEGFDPAEPGCILLDMRMPGARGITIKKRLTSQGVHTSIIFMTGRADVPEALQALRSGAVDVLVKPFNEEAVLSAVERATASDVRWREDEERRETVRWRWRRLSRRERQVVDLVLSGMLNKQIAAELGISQRTVEVHRHHAMNKMEADCVLELYKMIVMIEPDPT